MIDRLVTRLIDDVNEYSNLLETEDWRLFLSLHQAVDDKKHCQRNCQSCLEFSIMMNMLCDFFDGVQRKNEENDKLIAELHHLLGIPIASNHVSLALDLVISPSYVKEKIPANLVQPYEKYAIAIRREVSRLAMTHYLNKQNKCNLEILSHANLEQEQVTDYNPASTSAYEELLYVDQNVISKYANDNNFRRQIENFKRKASRQFIYSPYVIEDGVKMSRARLSEYFDSIEKLTDNTMLVRSKNGLILAKENAQITLDRVLLWKNVTRAAEDRKISVMNYNYWGHPYYSRGSKLSERANKDIHEFLASFRPYLCEVGVDVDLDDHDSDRALYRRLSAATIGKSFSLNALVNDSITHESDAQCIACIEHLCEFLDLINYQTEPLSELSKIRSSLQDTEHLKHAWKADYFVTDDRRLRTRGDFIYAKLGLRTKFIGTKDLKERIAGEFKD
ncbi:hypothetical protein [Stenotrophomonas sp. S48]|uniref:hypothetical protein n=1 Tax=Stenotrophomonas sp. S48 TaxID=2767465 RepID=UPI001900F6B4|nr:hypothetical protein [Stenotrophomonas sp. S48]